MRGRTTSRCFQRVPTRPLAGVPRPQSGLKRPHSGGSPLSPSTVAVVWDSISALGSRRYRGLQMSEGTAKPAPATRRTEEALRVGIAELGIGIAQVSLHGKWVAVSRRLLEILGYSEDELLQTAFEDLFPLPNLGSDVSLSTRESVETRVYRRDGTPILLRVALSPIHDEQTNRAHGLVVLVEESASRSNPGEETRKHAQQLMNLQETERSRIARELHEDISQSLAILAVQLEQTGKPISGEPDKKHASPQELSNRARSIAARVSRLSDQLHSLKLEYLGLVKTVQGECREFSERQRIPVDCSCAGVPTEVEASIELCFLRVLQETLLNIARHSRATNVRVELTGRANELRLDVTDNGIGFDVEQAGLTKGVGLINMRERMHLVGGELNLSSKPGAGTLVMARVSWSAR
jgi:PAS domain S-box-containing protein